LQLATGEIQALVGENGAGKSTLARILCGLTSPDNGEMELLGKPYKPTSRVDAERLGVRIVLQELNLIGTLSVAENLFLRKIPSRLGLIDYRVLHSRAAELLEQVGLESVDPRAAVETLGVGVRQMIEIAAALSEDCRLLILDEPTAALTEVEAERLFGHLFRLREAGVAIVYVSHRMEEIKRLADRITILRDGLRITMTPASEISLDEIIRHMVGRDLTTSLRNTRSRGSSAMRVVGVGSGSVVKDVSFELFEGEILGVAGLMGSGRTETVRTLFGADRRTDGELYLQGSDQPAQISSPQKAVKNGLALLTEDRKDQGLMLPRPIRENLTLPWLRRVSNRFGWIRSKREFVEASAIANRLDIRCQSLEQPVGELSGGNQQKVVFAKWLATDCRVLLVDEPTRGIDVGAKFEIYELLNDLASQGKAILVVSSDLPELMAICDRILVMSGGRMVATFSSNEWTADKIMAAALSGHENPLTSVPQR